MTAEFTVTHQHRVGWLCVCFVCVRVCFSVLLGTRVCVCVCVGMCMWVCQPFFCRYAHRLWSPAHNLLIRISETPKRDSIPHGVLPRIKEKNTTGIKKNRDIWVLTQNRPPLFSESSNSGHGGREPEFRTGLHKCHRFLSGN